MGADIKSQNDPRDGIQELTINEYELVSGGDGGGDGTAGYGNYDPAQPGHGPGGGAPGSDDNGSGNHGAPR